MDPYIHTLLATSLMFASFMTGKYFGRGEGHRDIIQTILEVFDASGMEINESGDFFITTNDGETKRIN